MTDQEAINFAKKEARGMTYLSHNFGVPTTFTVDISPRNIKRIKDMFENVFGVLSDQGGKNK